MHVRVAGGTGAGCKRQKILRAWIHVCRERPVEGGRVLSSYSCADCGARRP